MKTTDAESDKRMTSAFGTTKAADWPPFELNIMPPELRIEVAMSVILRCCSAVI